MTSVRDVHNAPDVILPLTRDDSPARPRIVAAGAMLDGPGSFWPNAIVVSDIASVRAAVRRQVEAGAGVIKVYTRLSSSMIAAVVQEARARGVPVAAHLGRATADGGRRGRRHQHRAPQRRGRCRQQRSRARCGARTTTFSAGWTAFELEWLRLQPPALEQVARTLVERGVTIVPTLALHEAFSRLADPGSAEGPGAGRRAAGGRARRRGRRPTS